MNKKQGAGYTAAAVLCPVFAYILARVAAPYVPDTAVSLFLYTGALEILLIGVPAVLLMLKKREAYCGMLSQPDIYPAGLVVLSSAAYALAAVLITALWAALLERVGIRLPLDASLPPVAVGGGVGCGLALRSLDTRCL